jgi:protein O-mannosyl-transferase
MANIDFVEKNEKNKSVGSSEDEAPLANESYDLALKAISLLPLLIILLFSFLVYFNALSGDFVYDDMLQIVDNPWIKDLRNIPTIFSKGVWSFWSFQAEPVFSNYYRPLMQIIYMLDYYIFGLKPWGFHLVNILFHCGVSVLVFLIVRKFLTEQEGTASSAYLSPPFIAAMLFASHPIHTEAVTWIAGLPEVSFTFFYLLSFYLYMSFLDGAKRGYLLSVLSFSVAILFKEPALTLPIMLIAYDYQLRKLDESISDGLKRYIPYVVISIVYLLVRYYVLGSFAPIESYTDLSTYQRIINVLPLFNAYLTSLLLPFNLNFWHTFHPISSLFEEKGMISVVVAIVFSIVAVAAFRKNKALFFSLLLFLVPLLPVFYIRGIIGKPFAERYLYLPSVGYVLFLAIFLSWAKKKFLPAGRSITIVFIVIVGLNTVGTIYRNNIWKDDVTIWSDTVKKSPDSAAAHHNLGFAYASKGQFDMAITEYQISLHLNPDDGEVFFNLANAYASKGQLDMAIAQYQIIILRKPDFADTYFNLGLAYASKGQLDMAIAQFQTALQLKPDYAQAHGNLGNAYASKGQFDMAIAEYQIALRLKPDYAQVHYNLAIIYLKKGNVDIAQKEVEMSLNTSPDFYEARKLLNDIISKRY